MVGLGAGGNMPLSPVVSVAHDMSFHMAAAARDHHLHQQQLQQQQLQQQLQQQQLLQPHHHPHVDPEGSAGDDVFGPAPSCTCTIVPCRVVSCATAC